MTASRNSHPLETQRLVFNPLQPMHVNAITALLGDDGVTRWMPGAPGLITSSYVESMIQDSLDAAIRGRALNLCIVKKTDQLVIGEMTLDCRTGEVAVWLGTNFQRQGYGAEALHALIDLARHNFGLPKLTASIVRGNLASCRLFEKHGFHFMGLQWRKHGVAVFPFLDYKLAPRGPDSALRGPRTQTSGPPKSPASPRA